eukprot:SAG11_NODE_6286_length_1344_cov_0.997590_1_plen_154_part_00
MSSRWKGHATARVETCEQIEKTCVFLHRAAAQEYEHALLFPRKQAERRLEDAAVFGNALNATQAASDQPQGQQGGGSAHRPEENQPLEPPANLEPLNLSDKLDNYMPETDDCVENLRNAKFLSVVDLEKGYWQMALHKDSRHKTANKCKFGHL